MAKRQGCAPSFCRVPSGLFSSPLLFYYSMSQAIIRIAKIKTKSAAQGKTKHNYRLMATLNADPERTATLNQELVNAGQLDYWSLAENRIEEGIAKTARGKPRTVRDDQVRAVEIVLTASPDWFKRGEDRQAEDVRGSQWVTDNLDFLKNKYGEKNVVSFTLHQDETTPHIHAVVIPLTDKGRLSADTLFNPDTLKQLQTDYAQAMAPHGLERGVEGSRRQHQDMKQVYGQQTKTAAELSSEIGPASSYQDAVVKSPNWTDALNLADWEARTTAQVNEKTRTQVEEANKRAQEAVLYAVANAGSQERAEVLSRQLDVSEGLKQGHYKDLVEARKEKIELAVGLAKGGAIPNELVKLGAKLREEDRLDTIKTFEKRLLEKDYSTDKEYIIGLQTTGLAFRKATDDNPNTVTHPRHGFGFTAAEVRPNGRNWREQVVEQVEAKRAAREKTELMANQASALQVEQAAHKETLRVEQAAQKVATYELTMMDTAFKTYRHNNTDKLTACLIVPDKLVKPIRDVFRERELGWAGSLAVQGNPKREDGRAAVYVSYRPANAHQVNQLLDELRGIVGVQMYEHASHKTEREQRVAQPWPKVQEREQEIGKSKDQGPSM